MSSTEGRSWSQAFAMAGATLVLGYAVLAIGDRLPDYGWDGTLYGRITEQETFRFLVRRKGNLDPYYVRRMLPTWVIHHILSLLHIDLVMPNIIRAYQVLNLLVLVGASLTWSRISEKPSAPWLARIVAARMASAPKMVCRAALRCSSESAPSPPASCPRICSKGTIAPVAS